MNFQVPQFIEIEDKVFGPLTFKQFLYVMGGAGLGYILFALPIIPFFIFRVIAALAALAFGLALAFYKVNDRPFIIILEAAIKYATTNKLYLWKKDDLPTQAVAGQQNAQPAQPTGAPIQRSRLDELTWSLDINEKIQ